LISRKVATLYELKELYSLEDVMNLLEICEVEDYNTRLASND
jgi:hypothetical protein